jgi:cytochrome P450
MSDNKVFYAASLCTAASFVALVLRWQRSRSRLPYPPGPKGYPLIGSAFDVPQDTPIWKTFISIAQNHNTDVLHVKMFSTDFIVLNSSEAISDLLEKRSSIYSDRPRVPMRELMDVYSWNLVARWYGTKWRKGRRLFHEFFNVKAVANFDDYQRKHAYRLISRLSQTPEDFLAHAQLVTGALIMEITTV